jgi:hypothetical protein
VHRALVQPGEWLKTGKSLLRKNEHESSEHVWISWKDAQITVYALDPKLVIRT